MNEPVGSLDTATLTVLKTVQEWVERGWLRPLDRALVQGLARWKPPPASGALYATALLSHLEQFGHSCLELAVWPGGLAALGVEPALLAALAHKLPEGSHDMVQALAAWGAVYCSGAGAVDLSQPLVMEGTRLYLRRYWQFERQIAHQIVARTRMPIPLDRQRARAWLDRLFPGVDQPTAPDWQKIACAFVLSRGMMVITGGPGTGKTYTAARLMVLLSALAPDPQQVRVLLAAPTGKAAARLKYSIQQALTGLQEQLGADELVAALVRTTPPALTLHALLGARTGTRSLRYHRGHPLPVDVLIVDEASMIHLEMMANVLEALPPQARLILLGDKDQLASVEAGAVLGELCAVTNQEQYHPQTARELQHNTGVILPQDCIGQAGSALSQHVVTLQQGQRFGADIAQLALAIHEGDEGRVGGVLRQKANLEWLAPAVLGADGLWRSPTQTLGIVQGYTAYLSLIKAGPDPGEDDSLWGLRVLQAFDQYRLLCAVRQGIWGVQGLNQAVQAVLIAQGWILAGQEWYEGRPVMVTRNDPDLGLLNGDVGIVLRSRSTPDREGLRVCFARGNALRSVSVSRLSGVETAFALTVHKSQGSEFQHVVLVLPEQDNGVTRELIYTAVTRARKQLTVVCPQPEVLLRGVRQPTLRSSGLRSQIEAAFSSEPFYRICAQVLPP